MSNILIDVRDAWRRALPLAVVVLRRARGSGTFRLVTLVVAAVLILSLISVAVYTAIELSRFQRVESRRTTLVYAAGQRLVPGVNVRTIDLAATLRRLNYKEVQAPARLSLQALRLSRRTSPSSAVWTRRWVMPRSAARLFGPRWLFDLLRLVRLL